MGGGPLTRIDHVGIPRGGDADVELIEVREAAARGVEVTWPPVRSGTVEMIWTEAEMSGGARYQLLRRPA